MNHGVIAGQSLSGTTAGGAVARVDARQHRPGRQTIGRVVIVVMLMVLAGILTIRKVPALNHDFIAYWSAARVLSQGGSPYDMAALEAAQRAAGLRYPFLLPVWYGPWIVAATTPIGLLPYWPARILWGILQYACLLASMSLLWRLYGGQERSSRPHVLLLTFAPTLLCLFEGQITPMILLGFAGFLTLAHRRRDALAGAALFPATAKPLTLYLVWLTAAVWTMRSRRLGLAAALTAVVAIAAAAAVAISPNVIAEWLAFGTERSPLGQLYTPTIGSVLRHLFGSSHLWLVYPPMIVGVAWWLRTWQRLGRGMSWRDELPMLAFVSLLTTPFGWSHDALLLLPAIVRSDIIGGESRQRTRAWFLLNALAVVLFPLLRFDQTWYLLYFVALFAWVRVGERRREASVSLAGR